MDTSSSLLIRLRRPDDSTAWDRFVRLYTPLLYEWGRQTRLQPADTADLVQDVLLTLMQKLPEFEYEKGRSFRGWLRTVAMNKWRDRCRRLAARPNQHGAEPLEEMPSPGEEAFEEIEYRRHLVARAMEVMQADFQPTTWKACWELVVADRPAADIAAELGISANAVYLAKGRVLRHLRKELDGLLD